MCDVVEKLGKSVIQHGKSNDRIYLMKLDKSNYPTIIKDMNTIAGKNEYTKIFAKVPEWAVEGFLEAGFIKEADIPGFYDGVTNVYFCSMFIDYARAFLDSEAKSTVMQNIKLALAKQNKPLRIQKNHSFNIKILTEDDIENLTELYSKVFKSYPFPIFDNDYIKKTMQENIVYFGVYLGNKLISASSAEMDVSAKNAEMTDFATDPDYAGNNLSLHLLREMEAEMRKRKMKTLYTIARSFSAAMNITFAKLDYKYTGTLVNNTNIFGKIESMNVWYKSLQAL